MAKKRSGARSHMPRSTMDYAAQRIIFEYAERNKVSFGEAIEHMLMQSPVFVDTMDVLIQGSQWFQNDVDKFKNSLPEQIR